MKFSLSMVLKDPKSWNPKFHVNDLMWWQTLLLRLCGMCHINFEDFLPKSLEFLSFSLNFVVLSFFSFVHIHLAVLFVYEMFRDNSIEHVTNAITMTIINSFAFFTLMHYKLNDSKYFKMRDFINEKFLTRSAYGLTFTTAERSYVVANRYIFIWMGMCLAGTLLWCVMPLFTSTRTLPIVVQYPIDQWSDPYYEIIYFIHTVCQYLTGMIFGNASSILASVVIMTCGQFDILICSLKNVRATAMTLNGHQLKELKKLQSKLGESTEEENEYYLKSDLLDDVETNTNLMKLDLDRNPSKYTAHAKNISPKDNYLIQFNEELSEALLACVRHHQMLMEFSKMIEEFFHMFILLKSFQTTFQLCNLTYTFITINGTFFQYLGLTGYLILSSLDLFQMCYFGEILKQQSSNVGNALFRCPWHLCGGPFRRKVLIVLSNSMKPLFLTGGKFFILDFNKLTGILKASFSYFTLLQKLGN